MTGARLGGDKRGGRSRGTSAKLSPTHYMPRDVALSVSPQQKASNLKTPKRLEELIDYRWPDALWVFSEYHRNDTYVVWVLDADYTYTQWLASRSLDWRWTLSPIGGPWDNRRLQERLGGPDGASIGG